MRLNIFDYFRAIAILFIVAGHCIGPWMINSFAEKTLGNLIFGGTVLFVFISGFFFHHVYHARFNYRAFMLKKIKKIAVPYLLLSALGFGFFYLSSMPFPYQEILMPEGLASGGDYALLAWRYLVTGKIATPYWYVPFIMVIFALSPLFIRFVRFAPWIRTALILILLAMALVIQRPLHNLSPLHALFYFLPVYLLGIHSSIHWDRVSVELRGRAWLLGALVLMLATLQVALTDSCGGLEKAQIFTYEGLDIILLQKILMCYFLLALLMPLEQSELPVLKLLANASFAIYFLHPWLLNLIWNSRIYDLAWFIPGFGDFILTIPVVVIGCLLVAHSARRSLKDKSRYLVGW